MLWGWLLVRIPKIENGRKCRCGTNTGRLACPTASTSKLPAASILDIPQGDNQRAREVSYLITMWPDVRREPSSVAELQRPVGDGSCSCGSPSRRIPTVADGS